MSTNNLKLLNDLVSVCRDGENFYLDAAYEVRDPVVKRIFERMALVRTELIDELRPHINIRGEKVTTSGTVAGRLHQWYTDMKAKLSSDVENAYIEELEEVEDKTIEAFEDAINQTDSLPVRHILLNKMPILRQAHNEMRALQAIS